jgi:acyl-coenzyme A synthetase/AMP-(fatty) acid ligase
MYKLSWTFLKKFLGPLSIITTEYYDSYKYIILHNYTVIEDILATGGLKDISLFCMRDRITTDHSSSIDTDAALISKKAVNLTKALEIMPDSAPLQAIAVNSRDVLLNIFTSGTTGMPKAVIMTNSRFEY